MPMIANDSSLEVSLHNSQLIPLAIFATAVCILGILGNALVIYSSIRYNAIEMDKVSLLFVQSLAVADFLYVFSNVLPSAVSYILRRYVMGKVYCFISAQTSFTYAQVNTVTVLTITAYRLRIIWRPLQKVSYSVAKIVAALIWIIASTTTIICLVYKSESVFSQKSAKCFSTIYIHKEKAAAVLFRITFGTCIVIPLIAIVFINVILFTISSRSVQKIKRSTGNEGSKARALTTVCALSSAFVISWTPHFIFLIWKGVNPDPPFVVEQVGITCIMINSFCNPILYTLTNKRFGSFVWRLMSHIVPERYRRPN